MKFPEAVLEDTQKPYLEKSDECFISTKSVFWTLTKVEEHTFWQPNPKVGPQERNPGTQIQNSRYEISGGSSGRYPKTIPRKVGRMAHIEQKCIGDHRARNPTSEKMIKKKSKNKIQY